MVNQREVVTLHFGQAGVQLGNAVWETMVTEHGIKANGLMDQIDTHSLMDKSAMNTFFHLSPSGQYMPRTLIVDSEPTVIDEIRTGYYRQLFHPDLLLSGLEDAANNFARGYYTIGKKMLYNMIEKVRFIIESCDNFRGFMTYSGSGGGTGSGLYSILLDRIMLEYSGKILFGTLIFPGKILNDTVVDPLNSVLRISQSINADLNVLMDNESMYKVCYDLLNILRPSYTNLNRLASPILSSVTAPFRFQGPVGGDLGDISTNLIPFPRINFPTFSYSPFTFQESLDHTYINTDQLLREVFQQNHNLLGLDLQKGQFMSSVLTFRGIHQMNAVIDQLGAMKTDHTFKWVDWCPTGFKVTQTLYPSVHHFSCQPQSSILMICNHSGITHTIEQLCYKFSILFKKRCFLHWFVSEGMEAEEMLDAMKNVLILKQDYEEVCKERSGKVSTYQTDTTRISSHSNLSQHRISMTKTQSIESSNRTKQKKEGSVKKIERDGTNSKASLQKKKKNFNEINENIASTAIGNDKTLSNNSSSESIKESKGSDGYLMTEKARNVIFNNISTLSAEQKQRLFGYVE